MKLKDIFNKKVNQNNKQISLDLRKKILKATEIDVDDILNMEIKFTKKEARFD